MPPRRPWRLGLVMVAVGALSIPARASAHAVPGPKSVLVLAQNDPSFPAFQEEMAGIRGVLGELPEAVTYHVEHLAGPRYGGPAILELQSAWLQQKYRGVHVDLILAAGSEAVRFVLRNRVARGDIPMVFFEVFAHVEEIPVEPRTTGLYVTVDAPGTIRLARQLLPATRSVAVVAGTPPRERAACASVSGQVRQEGLEVLDLCGLPMADVLQRVSSLPEATVVLYLSVSVDGAGVTFVPAEVATRVARDANRPVFSPHGTHLGRGVVGGVIIDYRMAGREIGEVARRVLAGEDPDRIPTRIAEVNRVALDARALRRWGIPRGRVPAGAEVVFDEPSLWQRYGQWILLGVLALVAQTFVIGALLVERRRRREAQRGAARAKELQDQIAHMNRVSSLGELSGAIAHELGQPLTAITSNAHATLSVLDRGEASIDDVRESVSDIALDARRASDVLGRMRAYLRREATAPRPVSLAAVADETARLVHATARRREVTVRVENAPDLPPVLGDEVQLLQVSLNLVTNAIEAAATGPGARQVTIRTQRAGASVELGVENSGSGIPPSVAERMFEPFFTTRADGLGMGLPICRTIVEAHGGRIWIRGDEPDRTELRFSLPQADVESLEVAAP